MASTTHDPNANPSFDFLCGGGEMGALIRAHDWSKTSLGPPAHWSQSLRTAIRLVLNTGHPMFLFWGPENAGLYNDAVRESIGPERHPSSLGRPAQETWNEVWPIVGPQIEQVRSGQGAIWQIDVKVPFTRNGRHEDIYWTYSYSPVDDETAINGIGGVLVICTETTQQVVATKRLTAERDHLARLFEQAPNFMALLRGPDHRFEIANPSYLRLVGHRPVLGRTIAEILPEAVAQGYLELLDQAFASGKAYVANGAKYTFEATQFKPASERVLNFVYQPIVGPDGNVTGIFVEGNDVTDEVLARAELEEANKQLANTADLRRESERRQAFRLALSDRIRPLIDPKEVMAVAGELLREHLDVFQVIYTEAVDSTEMAIVSGGWSEHALALLEGVKLRLADFGPSVAAALQAGQVLAIPDVSVDQRTAPYTDVYAANGIQAFLAIPVMKAGRLRAVLGVHHSRVHHWTANETAMANDVADRTWSAVDSARAEVTLRRERDHSQYIFDSMTEGFAVIDAEWTVLQANSEALRITQRTASEVVGRCHWDIWPELRESVAHKLYERVMHTGKPGTVEMKYLPPDGKEAWIEIRAYRSFDEGLAVFFRDITERRRADELVLHASLHDLLTGLPNRAMLFEFAALLLPHNQRTNQRSAVLFLDLDRFKPINDTHGHETGDEVLMQVSERLSGSVRAEDLVARVGGDEFVVLLQDIKHAGYAADVARHIIDKINTPYSIGELSLSVSTSVGISVFPDNGQDIDTLVNNADVAMYQAKQAGRNNLQFYSPEFGLENRFQMAVEQKLKAALHNGDFYLSYQPVIDIITGETVSAEALLRWKNNDISPERFVPIAEATGIINRIGQWVLSEAARQHKAWIADGLPAIPISINISVVEFRDRDFVARFERLIDQHAFNPSALQLELTETAVMDNIEHAVTVLTQLRRFGFKILLDDFGTGHSSLAYLAQLPLDKIKIDKSFISRLESDVGSRAVTDAMLALGRTMNLEVIAEGIETAAALDYIRTRGCDQAQGYYFSKPMSGDAFKAWYRKGKQDFTDEEEVVV